VELDGSLCGLCGEVAHDGAKTKIGAHACKLIYGIGDGIKERWQLHFFYSTP
jgi:hypothetical protein